MLKLISATNDYAGGSKGAGAAPGLSPGQMISSLRQRNYRLFFFGQLVSVAGTWMQTVAQSFVVLDLTHSGTQLGLTSAARFLPMFVFGPLGGVFADRMDRRRVLYVTQTLSGLLAGVFAVTVGTHSIRLWIVYLLALALGFVNVFDNPARQSFISEMVSAEDLPNAVTLNSVAMNMARVLGAALGGVIAAAIGLACASPVTRSRSGRCWSRWPRCAAPSCSRPNGSASRRNRSGRACATCGTRRNCSSRSS